MWSLASLSRYHMLVSTWSSLSSLHWASTGWTSFRPTSVWDLSLFDLLITLLVAAVCHIMFIFSTRVRLDHALVLPWLCEGFSRSPLPPHPRSQPQLHPRLYFPCCGYRVPSYLKKKNQLHFSFSSVQTIPRVLMRDVSPPLCRRSR